jgi:hypothetical protein
MLTLPDLVDFFVNKCSGLSARGFVFALGLARLFNSSFPWHSRFLENGSLLIADAVP